MTPFTFEVQRGRYAGGRCADAVYADETAAWQAAVDLCADLLKGMAADLTPEDPEWCLKVSDKRGRTLFRFRLVAEGMPSRANASRATIRRRSAPSSWWTDE